MAKLDDKSSEVKKKSEDSRCDCLYAFAAGRHCHGVPFDLHAAKFLFCHKGT